jgi:hypothetical protein
LIGSLGKEDTGPPAPEVALFDWRPIFDEMTNLSKKFREELNQISLISELAPPDRGGKGRNKKFLFNSTTGTGLKAS